MKRANLVFSRELLEEAQRLTGERTFSRTVERALEEMVRRIKAGQILKLAGSGLWDGNLSEMRGDDTSSAKAPARKSVRSRRVPR